MVTLPNPPSYWTLAWRSLSPPSLLSSYSTWILATLPPSISELPVARIRELLPPLFRTLALVPFIASSAKSLSTTNSARLTWPEILKSTACAAIGAARAPAIATVSALSATYDPVLPPSRNNPFDNQEILGSLKACGNRWNRQA